MNEYIPSGDICTYSSSYLSKNIFVFSKVDPHKDWSAIDRASPTFSYEYLAFRQFNNDQYFSTTGTNRGNIQSYINQSHQGILNYYV